MSNLRTTNSKEAACAIEHVGRKINFPNHCFPSQNIFETDHVNSILAAGRADLVALGRPHMIDPMWTLRAAAQHEYDGAAVPPPYLAGMAQLTRNLKRAAEMEAAQNG